MPADLTLTKRRRSGGALDATATSGAPSAPAAVTRVPSMASAPTRPQRLERWTCPAGHRWRACAAPHGAPQTRCPACLEVDLARAVRPISSGDPHDPAPGDLAREACVEHRRFEQLLALLGSDLGVGDELWRRFVTDLTAYLDVNALLLYPELDRVARRPMGKPRELQEQVRWWLAGLHEAAADAGSKFYRLRGLRAAFRHHATFDEHVVIPTLQRVVARETLETLTRKMRAARALLVARQQSRTS